MRSWKLGWKGGLSSAPVRPGRRTFLLDTQAFLMAATEGWTDLPKRVRRLLADMEWSVL